MITRDEKDAFYIKNCSNQLVADNYFPTKLRRIPFSNSSITTVQKPLTHEVVVCGLFFFLFFIIYLSKKNLY